MMDTFSGISTVKKTFEEASSIMGKDMWNLMTEGPEDQLSVTTNTQPLMLISDVSMYRVWLEL
jgi:[acyl-carrier-protein] S-malonyltransferase